MYLIWYKSGTELVDGGFWLLFSVVPCHPCIWYWQTSCIPSFGCNRNTNHHQFQETVETFHRKYNTVFFASVFPESSSSPPSNLAQSRPVWRHLRCVCYTCRNSMVHTKLIWKKPSFETPKPGTDNTYMTNEQAQGWQQRRSPYVAYACHPASSIQQIIIPENSVQ